MTATLRKIGGSLAIVIPRALAEGMNAGDRIDLREQPEGILLIRRKKRPGRLMSEIIKGLDPKAYARHNNGLLSDPPVGREVI